MKITVDGEKVELGWHLWLRPVGYDQYAHASVKFGYESDGRFESLFRLTYQTDCAPRSDWERERKGATVHPANVASGLDREWRGWYGESIEFESSGVSAQLTAATAFVPVWAKIQAVIEDKNLHYKYCDDQLAQVVAALNTLKCQEWHYDEGTDSVTPETWSNWAWLK